MSGHRRFPRLLIVGAVVIAIAAGCTPSPSPVPTRQALTGPTPPTQPLLVSAARVRDNGPNTVIVGLPVTVSGHALGTRGVAALELWDGAQLVDVEQPDHGSPPAFYARWSWTPATSGPHALLVRAVDGAGGVVQSNAVRVEVNPALTAFAPPPRPAVALPDPLAWHAGVSLLSPRRPSEPPKYASTVDYGIAVPAVQSTLDGCTLQLAISNVADSATGIQIVGLAPSTQTFEPLLRLEPSAARQTQTVTLADQGTFLFSVAAFDTSVEAYAAPIEVAVPAQCESDSWAGEVSLVDGVLHPAQPVERGYLYVTQGDGASLRVPAVQGEFVEAAPTGELDFGPVLPALDTSTMEIEAWGWNGGTLVNLGKGTYTPPTTAGGGLTFGGGQPQLSGATLTSLKVISRRLWTPELPLDVRTDCGGGGEFCYYDEPLLASTIDRPAIGSTAPIPKTFRWTTVLANVSQLAWQILPYPPAGTADLAPPFLMDEGVIAVAPGQSEGEFTLDFAKYFKASVPTLDITAQTQENLALGPVFPGFGTSPTATPAPGAGSGSSSDVGSLLSAVGAFNGRFYVRLVPIELGSAMLPSNPVTLDVVEPAEPLHLDVPLGPGWNENAYTVAWTYTPPLGANSKYSRCAIVTAIDPSVSGMPGMSFYQGHLQSGEPICYTPPSDDGWSPVDVFEAVVEFAADVWDYIGDGYAYIKKKVVEAVLIAVPCTQVASDAVCEQIANTALDVALASMGIPPSLPDFDAVVAGLKGDLATLIVESASSLPGVGEACGLAEAGNTVTSKVKTCEELAAIAIDKIVEQVELARSEAAGKASGAYYPGVTFEPDPRGIYHSPVFDLTITRTADPQLPSSCSLSVSMESTVKNWTFPELWQGIPKNVTATVSGEPFWRASMVIPPLKPGESISRQLWLTTPRKWFESQRAEWYWYYHENLGSLPGFTRAWALLTFGASLTFGIQSNCAKPSEQGPYVLPKDSIYSGV